MVRRRTCDPVARGIPFNTMAISKKRATVEIRFGWDGTSVPPDCDGPVTYLRVTNTASSPRYVWLPEKKKGDKHIVIPPGADITMTPEQLADEGLTLFQDCAGVGLGDTPTPPG